MTDATVRHKIPRLTFLPPFFFVGLIDRTSTTKRPWYSCGVAQNQFSTYIIKAFRSKTIPYSLRWRQWSSQFIEALQCHGLPPRSTCGLPPVAFLPHDTVLMSVIWRIWLSVRAMVMRCGNHNASGSRECILLSDRNNHLSRVNSVSCNGFSVVMLLPWRLRDSNESAIMRRETGISLKLL